MQCCRTPDLVGGNTFWFGFLKGKQASEGHQGISFDVFSSPSTLLLLISEQLLELFPYHHLPSSHQKWLRMEPPAFLSCLGDFSDLTSDKQHTVAAQWSWWEEMGVSGYPERFERTHNHFSSQAWAAGLAFWHTAFSGNRAQSKNELITKCYQHLWNHKLFSRILSLTSKLFWKLSYIEQLMVHR